MESGEGVGAQESRAFPLCAAAAPTPAVWRAQPTTRVPAHLAELRTGRCARATVQEKGLRCMS